MYSYIRLQNFRSYKDHAIELEPGVNIVVGANASGKTNLLEGFYVASQNKSFKAKTRELVQDGKDWARIDAVYNNSNRIVKIQPPKQPTLVVDDTEVKRANKWAKQIPVVLFDPEDLRLLKGSPERRRQYLDVTLSQSSAIYQQNLSRYKRALMQRNKLLKEPGVYPDELFVWDVKLAEHGSEVAKYRQTLTKQLNKELSKLYSAISGKKYKISVEYSLNYLPDSSALLKSLHKHAIIDKTKGFTTVGPHRDDILFRIDGEEAQSHASRGETRSLVLSLKILEAQIYEKEHGVKPVILLDDVFSELDASRRRHLTQYLQNHQTIITTTDADAVIEHFSGGEYKIIPVSKV